MQLEELWHKQQIQDKPFEVKQFKASQKEILKQYMY